MKNGVRDERAFLYKKSATELERDKRKESYRDVK